MSWYSLPDYISDGYLTSFNDQRDAFIHVKIECKPEELTDIR